MTDVFRNEYKELTQFQKAGISCVKQVADALFAEIAERYVDIESIQGKKTGLRELNIAKTKLEECVMWATKGLTA